MSLILGLDTSTRQGALALIDLHSGHCWTDDHVATQNHGRDLVPAIGRLFSRTGRTIKHLGGIAVGIGPGSYTGLRVGIAVAKTIADVLDIPIVPIDSLILPVLATPADAANCCVSIADAQRGAVAQAVYQRNASSSHWERTSGPVILPWEELHRWKTHSDPVFITGPGLELAKKFGPTSLTEAPRESWLPSSNALSYWLRTRYEFQPAVEPDALEPAYLRPSAAEEKRQAAAEPGPGAIG